jgi:hypothetical protein
MTRKYRGNVFYVEMFCAPTNSLTRFINIKNISVYGKFTYKAQATFKDGEVIFPEEHNQDKQYEQFILDYLKNRKP